MQVGPGLKVKLPGDFDGGHGGRGVNTPRKFHNHPRQAGGGRGHGRVDGVEKLVQAGQLLTSHCPEDLAE
jgi:hypothetical protein